MKKVLFCPNLLPILLLLCLVAGLMAETITSPIVPATADSLQKKTVREDSLFYSGDSLYYDYDGERIQLTGNANIQYQSSTIDADSLSIDLKKKQAWSKGRTTMTDGEQILLSRDVRYDMDSKTGVLGFSASRFDKGFYYGDEIRKVGPDVYDVDNGRFTTCDAEDPDFYIYSRYMRLYRDDKVVGKPVVFFVNHFPVMGLPFGTFSIRRGRHAGFMVPEPGYNTTDGKYIKNIAFYVPYREYADGTVSFDYMENTGWNASLETQYIKRYAYNGDFTARLQRRTTGNLNSYDWSLRGNHAQELAHKARFNLSIDFASSKSIWAGDTNDDDRLRQQITSNFAYSRPLFSSTLSIGSSYTEDLTNDQRQIVLPSASYSLPSKPVYELFLGKQTSGSDAWYSNLSYSYYIRAVHSGFNNSKHASMSDIIWDNQTDSTTVISQHNVGVMHNAGLYYAYRLWGWLNLTQSFNYDEAWYDRDKNDKDWVRGYDYNTASSMSFSLTGIRNFRSKYITSVRHIVSPNISFGYTPSFPENDKYYSFSGISLRGNGKSRNVSFSLDQRWSVKLAPTAKRKELKLTDLLTWSSSIGYNLENDNKPFGDIYHRVMIRPAAFTIKTMNANYSTSLNGTQDSYALGKTHAGLKTWSVSQNLSFSGNAPYTDYFPHVVNPLFQNVKFVQDSTATGEITKIKDMEQVSNPNQWTMSFVHNMSVDYGDKTRINQNLSTDASLRITKNWAVNYSNWVDLKNLKLVSQTYNITRDLHCWKLEIRYSRSNDYWDYRVVLFNTQLPDALRIQTSGNQ